MVCRSAAPVLFQHINWTKRAFRKLLDFSIDSIPWYLYQKYQIDRFEAHYRYICIQFPYQESSITNCWGYRRFTSIPAIKNRGNHEIGDIVTILYTPFRFDRVYTHIFDPRGADDFNTSNYLQSPTPSDRGALKLRQDKERSEQSENYRRGRNSAIRKL